MAREAAEDLVLAAVERRVEPDRVAPERAARNGT
jgi:hypothetical protein